MNEFVDLLPAQQRIDEESLVPRHRRRGVPEPGHHRRLRRRLRRRAGRRPHLQDELRADAGRPRGHGPPCTVGCIEVPREEASAFGVMAIDEQHQIIDFVEKPADPPPMPGKPDMALASMGIYIFDADYLYEELERDMRRPGVEPRLRQGHHPARGAPTASAVAHPFDLSCVVHARRRRALLARRRHDRRLLGRQHRPHRHHAAARPVRHALADLDLPAAAAAGQVRAQRGRPARRGDRIDGLGRLHRLGLGVPLGAVLQRARALACQRRTGRWCCPSVQVGRRRAADAHGGRPRLRASRTAW